MTMSGLAGSVGHGQMAPLVCTNDIANRTLEISGILWVMTPCGLAGNFRRFGGTHVRWRRRRNVPPKCRQPSTIYSVSQPRRLSPQIIGSDILSILRDETMIRILFCAYVLLNYPFQTCEFTSVYKIFHPRPMSADNVCCVRSIRALHYLTTAATSPTDRSGWVPALQAFSGYVCGS